jgi:hypothetical protein
MQQVALVGCPMRGAVCLIRKLPHHMNSHAFYLKKPAQNIVTIKINIQTIFTITGE